MVKKKVKSKKMVVKKVGFERIPIAIGQSFKYMGIQFYCTHHRVHSNDADCIYAQYSTIYGELKECVFRQCTWEALMKNCTVYSI